MKFNLSLFALLTFMNPIVPYSDSSEDEMEEVVETPVVETPVETTQEDQTEAPAKTTQETQTDPRTKIQHVAVLCRPNLAYSLGFRDRSKINELEETIRIQNERIETLNGQIEIQNGQIENQNRQIQNLREHVNSRHAPIPMEHIRLRKVYDPVYKSKIEPGTGSVTLLVDDKKYRFNNNAYVEALQAEEKDLIKEIIESEKNTPECIRQSNILKERILNRAANEPFDLQTLLRLYDEKEGEIQYLSGKTSELNDKLDLVRKKYKDSEETMNSKLKLTLIYWHNYQDKFYVGGYTQEWIPFGNQYYRHDKSDDIYCIKVVCPHRAGKDVLCLEYLDDSYLIPDLAKIGDKPKELKFYHEVFEDITDSVEDDGDMEDVDDAQESEVESPEDYGEMEEVDDL